ncbi:hypothetical protein ACIBKY_03235 [Nonomuraea sp. NPDC050394]|uniref:hypothetical protein n=1 Tax=Nonomuraea sp. NPDC050394 TaxID=3364363 RepID=UPI0037B454AD
MSEILGFDPLRDVAPPYWAAAGALALALVLGLIRLVKRLIFPRQAQSDTPPRSLANAVTWACAAAALVFAGEGMFEVIREAAPDVWWLPWLGIGLLEGPLLAFALRAKELIAQQRFAMPDQVERLTRQVSQATRMTWLLASGSAVLSASAALDAGTPSVPLLRAAAPIVGVILWHHALRIEQESNGGRKRETRWKWTPEYILTRLGLVTARASETADAEVHMRLTKVADWVIRYARSIKRNADRNGWWNAYLRWRMEHCYRAAERDLDLTRNADRRALLEQIIASRSDAVLLTTLAGVTRTDLGLSEVESPERNVRIVYPKPVERAVRDTRVVFQKRVVERLVERPTRITRVVFPKPVERPAWDGRNAPETQHRDASETAARDARNGRSGTPIRNGGTPTRNGGGRATREEIDQAIAAEMKPTGEVPIRPLAERLGIPKATMHRHVTRYRQEHGLPTPQGVIPPPHASGHALATVGGGETA